MNDKFTTLRFHRLPQKKNPNIILALRQEQMLVILNRYMVEHALNNNILYAKVKIRLVMSTNELPVSHAGLQEASCHPSLPEGGLKGAADDNLLNGESDASNPTWNYSFTVTIRLNSPALNPAHQMTSGTQKTSRGSEKDFPILQDDIVLPNGGQHVESVLVQKQGISTTFQ